MAERRVVVVLEDGSRRVEAVRRALGGELELRVFARAHEFGYWLREGPADVALISLDYHLGPRSAGTGLDAAAALALLEPFAPVILHSSDSVGARAQQELLEAAGWQTERLVFDEYAWAAALARLVPVA